MFTFTDAVIFGIFGIIYLLLIVFVLAVMFLKIVRKEKIHQIWFWILGFLLIIIPILFFSLFFFHTSITETMETIEIIN
jgi:hypothetical protein